MHPRTYSSYMKHNILVHLVLRLDLGIFLNHIPFFVLLLLFLFTEVSAKNHQFIMSHDLWRNANNRAPSHIIYQSEILQISYPWARFHKIHQLAVVFAGIHKSVSSHNQILPYEVTKKASTAADLPRHSSPCSIATAPVHETPQSSLPKFSSKIF